MPTFVMRGGKLVEKWSASPLIEVFAVGPAVISDTMDTIRHMATGRYHTSKAEFRRDTKSSGCVEIGNDPAITRPRKPTPLDRGKRREDIKRTIYNLRNGEK